MSADRLLVRLIGRTHHLSHAEEADERVCPHSGECYGINIPAYTDTAPYTRQPRWYLGRYIDIIRAQDSQARAIDWMGQFLRAMEADHHPGFPRERLAVLSRELANACTAGKRTPTIPAEIMRDLGRLCPHALHHLYTASHYGGQAATMTQYVAYIESHWVAPQTTKTVMPVPTMGRFTRRLSL